MNDIDYNNIQILSPVGIDLVCEEIASNLSLLPIISSAFGRCFKHEIDGKSKPLYFSRRQSPNFSYVDMSINRDFCKPAYSFCYPHGMQKVNEDEGIIYMTSQRLSLIVVMNIEEFASSLNHVFIEEIKTIILQELRKMAYFTEISVYDEPKEVWKGFDMTSKTATMYPYASIKFDMLATFQSCEENIIEL